MKALEGVRVIDLTRVLAGPYCTMMLADHGAEVIKVEIPGTGDDARAYAPFVKGQSAYFANINRGKKSITLNLKTQEGKDLLKKLVAKADVLVENYRPGTMEKLGLGYDVLKEINPRLIYGASSGFGHTGPWSKLAAYDLVIQAMSGFMSVTGQENSIPTKAGPSIMDITSGIFLYTGILTALYNREKTGKGQQVDVAMLDCAVAILESAVVDYAFTGEIPGRIGNRHPSICPFESFKASDDFFVIACGNDHLYSILCNLLNRPDLIKDERFKNNEARLENHVALEGLLNAEFAKKTAAEWVELLDKAGVPTSTIDSVDKVFKNPQIAARQMFVDVEHPVMGKSKLTGVPVKLSNTPGSVDTASPLLGQDTEAILRDLAGVDAATLADLKAKKAI